MDVPVWALIILTTLLTENLGGIEAKNMNVIYICIHFYNLYLWILFTNANHCSFNILSKTIP